MKHQTKMWTHVCVISVAYKGRKTGALVLMWITETRVCTVHSPVTLCAVPLDYHMEATSKKENKNLRLKFWSVFISMRCLLSVPKSLNGWLYY